VHGGHLFFPTLPRPRPLVAVTRAITMPRHWLMKSEPDEVSIDRPGRAPGQVLPWTGVRNYQARNFMRDDMQPGDGVLFYHSSCPQPGIAGLAEIAGACTPTPRSSTPPAPTTTPSHRPTSRAGCRSPCGWCA
jgi:predicted RNA-binding protein with PUA-like domain